MGTGLAAGFVTGGTSSAVRGTWPARWAPLLWICTGGRLRLRLGCCGERGFRHGLYVSGEKARAAVPGNAAPLPARGARVDVEALFRLAEAGDPLCVRLVEQAVQTLSCLILNLVRFTDPDTFILGGGIIKSGWLMGGCAPCSRSSPS